jgi:MFS family permease
MDSSLRPGRTFRETFQGHGTLVAAMIVDGIGTGLFLPFGIVYFLHTTAISLAVIGAGLSAAALAALPAPVAAGAMIDRFGPRRVVAAGNLLSATAFLGYLFVGSAWQLVVAAFVASAGQATFWTATRVLVGVVAGPSRRAHWFALQTTTRNLGYGLGAIAGAVAIGQAGRAGYLSLAAVNAASYLIASVLVLRASIPDGPEQSPRAAGESHREASAPAAPGPGYRQLLTDRGLLLISSINVSFVLCTSVLSVLLAVYLSTALHAAVWLTGALFAVDTIFVITCQTTITSRASGHDRVSILTIAAGAFAVSFALLWALAGVPAWLIVPGLIIAVTVFAIAGMLQGPIINALAVDMAPPQSPGRYLAIYQLSWSLGGGLAPALLTSLTTLSAALPWITLIAACALAVLALHTASITGHARPPASSAQTHNDGCPEKTSR